MFTHFERLALDGALFCRRRGREWVALVPKWLVTPGFGLLRPPLLRAAPGRDGDAVDVDRRPEGPLLVDVLLDDALALRREVSLPVNQLRRRAEIMRYDLQRIAPFGLDDLLWRDEVVGRSGAAVRCEQVVVRKSTVDAIAKTLADEGRRVRTMRARRGDGDISVIADFRPMTDWIEKLWRRLAVASAIVAVAALGVADALDRQATAAERERLEAELASLREEAYQRARHRNAVAEREGDAALLVAALMEHALATATIEALTDALPDSVSLTTLSLEGRRLVIGGVSSEDPARLIAVLEQTAFAELVGFAGPVAYDPTGGLSRFDIEMRLAVQP